MKKLSELWAMTAGLKTTASALYWGTVCPSLLVLFPNGVPADVNKWVTIIGFFLTSIGVGDKFYRKYVDKRDN
jgi:hypothetical protein